ncbi:MAG: ClpXP protease specificity-enhancing factor [Candidatus Kinetoplastibacterium crithidii]|nr:MAG: ClpXP protease specificity-enhancing factor [Candidatus Kinetoplastibacterium crithidii]
MDKISTKPYFIRAIFEWCTDNNYSPHILVSVDKNTLVPTSYVQDHKIILNISQEACNNIEINNNFIKFQARFNGIIEDIFIPMERILYIFSKETGYGMEFQIENTEAIKIEKKAFSIVK